MHFQGQLIFHIILLAFLMLWIDQTTADNNDEEFLNNLYNNLLQREYAGPVVFPNHQVERKAQRSPSLRLRFGRRSDPELTPHTLEKRWFGVGDVNKKPIRSPSRRLRFGRSDPSMPIHSPFDMLMNAQDDQALENSEDYNDIFYNRVVRKPQRLRFGRSLPFETLKPAAENDLLESGDDVNEASLLNNEEDFYNTLMQSQKLRNLLMALNRYDNQDTENVEENMNEFERAIRKPGPLRLRWGRSTGGSSSVSGDKVSTDLEQKNKVPEITNEVEKSLNQQTKD